MDSVAGSNNSLNQNIGSESKQMNRSSRNQQANTSRERWKSVYLYGEAERKAQAAGEQLGHQAEGEGQRRDCTLMRGERLEWENGTSELNTSRVQRENLARSTEENAQKKTKQGNKMAKQNLRPFCACAFVYTFSKIGLHTDRVCGHPQALLMKKFSRHGCPKYTLGFREVVHYCQDHSVTSRGWKASDKIKGQI